MSKIIEYFEKNFYTNLPSPFHYIGIYVVGDLIVLIPFILIFFPLIFLWKGLWGLGVSWTLFMGVRHMFEVIYWFLQQFGNKEYRPGFPTKRFGNNEVYIIHQLLNMVYGLVYLTIFVFLVIDR